MFINLDDKDFNIIIQAMDVRKCTAGETVITEGEPGDVLYIHESGKLTCTKVIDGASKVLKTYDNGEVFGELALLYNAPRAATITADEDSTLFSLDRETFNAIVKEASQKKREQFEDFLTTVPILQNMDHYERSKLADVIKETKYAAGTQIIKQGDQGDSFYILVEGEAYATLNSGPAAVMQYKPGDYFGELSLLKD